METTMAITQNGSLLGLALGLLGAGLCLGMGGAGSSIGVGYAGMTASGVVTEDPNKFGKLIPFVAIPGTQLLFIGFSAGIVEYMSAVYQGKVASASIGIIAKRPDQVGKGFILPAFVETYAIIALVATLLIVIPMKIG